MAAMSTLLSIKVLSLSALCVLMTVMTILMHITRTRRDPGQPAYKPASAVLLTEVGKLVASLLLSFREVKHLLRSEERESLALTATNGYERDDDDARTAARRQEKTSVLYDADARNQPQENGRGHHDDELERQPGLNCEPESSVPRRRGSEVRNGDIDAARAADSQRQAVHKDPDEVGYAYTMGQPPISFSRIASRMWRETFGPDWLKLSVPAFLFTGQSNLAYYASSNLSVPVFQITYQLKIPATALCSVVMLKRALSRLQWIAIALLSIGVGIVQLATQSANAHNPAEGKALLPNGNTTSIDPLVEAAVSERDSILDKAKSVKPQMNQLLGLLAVCLACLSSGFASVYFEKQLKKAPAAAAASQKPITPLTSHAPARASATTSTSNGSAPGPPAPAPTPRKTGLWIRNIQLSLFSLSVGSVIYIFTSTGSFADFLQGFNSLVWILVGLQVLGGLLAALVIQYADNIAKSFSASCSIILSFIASIYMFDFQLTVGVMAGSAAVIGATWLFNAAPPASQPKVSAAMNGNGGQNGDYVAVRGRDSMDAEYLPLQESSSSRGSSSASSGLPNAFLPSIMPSWPNTNDSRMDLDNEQERLGGSSSLPASRRGSTMR